MMNERKFLISVEMSDDYSEYNLVCYLNGELIKKEENYSLSDCCIGLNDFQRSVYEDYNVDSRFDEFRIKLDICC